MILLVVHLVISGALLFATGGSGLTHAGAALAIGFAVVALLPLRGVPRYRRTVLRGSSLMLFYLWELVVSSVRVAIDVLRPRLSVEAGVVAVPLDARTDWEITALANLISLTPGSLTLEVSQDRRTLYVHTMHLDGGDPERFRQRLKADLEQRVLRVSRG
jgi:multicomponent Na+:H+ antiporter subunit E